MKKSVSFLLFAIAMLLFISCDEDHDADDHEHEHFEPTIWEFVDDTGAVYLRVDEGVISQEYNTEFSIEANSESGLYTINFYDSDGDLQEPHLDEYSLSWEIKSGDEFFEINQHEGEEGSFEFHFEGKEAGSGTVVFKVMHGDHSDLITPEISVIVE